MSVCMLSGILYFVFDRLFPPFLYSGLQQPKAGSPPAVFQLNESPIISVELTSDQWEGPGQLFFAAALGTLSAKTDTQRRCWDGGGLHPRQNYSLKYCFPLCRNFSYVFFASKSDRIISTFSRIFRIFCAYIPISADHTIVLPPPSHQHRHTPSPGGTLSWDGGQVYHGGLEVHGNVTKSSRPTPRKYRKSRKMRLDLLHINREAFNL